MAYELALPKDKEQREAALVEIIATGERIRKPKEVQWWLAHHYLQGARDFTNIDYNNGTLDVNYINEDGVLRFRYDEIVSKFQAQIGRLMQIDLAPRVQRKSIGLEDLKKASIAQVVLDSVFPTSKVEQIKLNSFPPMTKYGAIGLVLWSEEEEIGIDVVMPWELVPIPPTSLEAKDVRGIARVRVVPLDWVKQLSITPSSTSKIWGQVEKSTVPIGSIPAESGNRFSTFGETLNIAEGSFTKGLFGKKKTDQTHVDMVRLVEVWVKTSAGYLSRYEMVAGKKIVYSNDYSKGRIHMPISVCNDIKTGDFWGRSFVSTQIPLNTEIEYTLGSLFQNVQDLDTYGILCIPSTLGIPPQVIRSSDGVKTIQYNPDYTAPDLKPFTIAPFKTGNFPVEVIKVGASLADKSANQPTEMMKGMAPGRVDSQAGLGFLYETSNIGLAPTAGDIAQAMANCYRAALDVIAMGAWSPDKLVQITMLDDSLAGIQLDSKTGSMSLAQNILPSPDEVSVSVRSMLPKSKEQEKMELMKALEIGSIDMFEYRTEVRKRGIELPVGNESEWQNYRRAMLENLILFGDGIKTGQVIFDVNDNHEVHLRVLQAFMARPEFYQADAEVRDAFKKHYEAHLMAMGQSMPDQMPYPEDAAAEAQMQEQMMGQQGGVPPQ